MSACCKEPGAMAHAAVSDSRPVGVHCSGCKRFLRADQFAYDAKGKLVYACDCGALIHLSLMGIRIG